jgi:hypothetical protein
VHVETGMAVEPALDFRMRLAGGRGPGCGFPDWIQA